MITRRPTIVYILAERPDVVTRLARILEAQVAAGRSTAGTPQANDVPVDIWKGPGIGPDAMPSCEA